MKTCLLALTALLFLGAMAAAQPPDTIWTRAYGGTATDEADAICPISTGGFYVAGRSRALSPQWDVWLLRINDLGDTLWTRAIGGAGNDFGTAVCEAEDGGAIVVGSTESFGAGSNDVYLVRTNGQGDTLWTRAYGGTSADFGYGIVRTFDGGYAVCGSKGTAAQSLNMYLLKFSATNQLQWQRDYGASNVDEAFALRQTADGGFVLAGRSVPPGESVPDMYVVRVTAAGDTVWTHRYSAQAWEEATGILETVDGGFLVTGWVHETGGDPFDFYVVKTTAAGAVQWSHTYGGSANDRATSVQQATDGGYIVGGYTTSYGAGNNDFYFVKLTTSGDTLWTRTNGGGGSDILYGLAVTPDGGYIAAGSTMSFGGGSMNGWAVRLSGFSGVGGTVRDMVTHQPLAGVHVGAVGQAHYVVSDVLGHYVLTLPPDTSYSIITFGPCVGRDTVAEVPVFQDSITALDLAVGVPHSDVPQTSVNIVAHNHMASSETLRIYNTGMGVLDMHVTTSTVSPARPWLSVNPAITQIEPGDSAHIVVTVTPDTTDTGVFDYYGYLTLHSNSCPDSARQVDVIAIVLDADDGLAAAPLSFSLGAYPNPFNPSTTLTFTLPKDEVAKLIIYDITGRAVQTLMEGFQSAGVHHFTINASAWASGLYLARLQTPSTSLMQKLLLLK